LTIWIDFVKNNLIEISNNKISDYYITCLKFSPNKAFFAVISCLEPIKILDPELFTEKFSLKCERRYDDLVFSLDSTKLITISESKKVDPGDNRIDIYETVNFTIITSLTEDFYLNTINFTKDDNKLVCGMRDGRIKFYSIGDNLTEISMIDTLCDSVLNLKFSKDEKYFVITTSNGYIKIYSSDSLELIYSSKESEEYIGTICLRDI